jgi:hypothetical protein
MQRNVNKKAESFRIKVTTYIQGSIKNKFVEELIAKGITEAELARQIIEQHFSNKHSRNIY